MENKKINKKEEQKFPSKDSMQKYHAPENKSSINNPARNLPAYNPPVPNRAWTAMCQDLATSNTINDFSTLTPEERAALDVNPRRKY